MAYLSEMRPCVQMKLLRKIFEQLNVYEIFSEFEQNFVVLWQQYFNRSSKMRFIYLEEFLWRFCYLESFKQLDNCFWKSRTLYS